MRKRVCIISFSPIYRDARVLRQLEYLSPRFDPTAIGYGRQPEEWPRVDWRAVEVRSNHFTRVTGAAWLALGRLWPGAYERWYWQKQHHREALRYALESGAQAYHANDWNALPVAAEAARRTSARLVLDAHEYAPAEFENSRSWRAFYRPLVDYFLRKYAPRLDGSMTVSPLIADRYRSEFGFDPLVVLNAPALVPLPPRHPDPGRVSLVYHGGASPDRGIESMIETVPLLDGRFNLQFMMVGDTPYVRSLVSLAERTAPGRIFFNDPVAPGQVVARIAQYDMGFYLLRPSNYNNRVALPNKFFDFLAAGLAVCVGPSTGMAQMVEEHGCGVVAPSFAPGEVAATLNALTPVRIAAMQDAAIRTAQEYNADMEAAKMVQLYEKLLDGES